MSSRKREIKREKNLSSDETECSRSNVKQKWSVKRRNKKKHSRTSPDVQFNEFSLTKKTKPKTYYEWIGKPISKKKQITKIKKKTKSMSKCCM